jgi:hypothetical protein
MQKYHLLNFRPIPPSSAHSPIAAFEGHPSEKTEAHRISRIHNPGEESSTLLDYRFEGNTLAEHWCSSY